ncbi:acyl-CoA N-acyltransferase [Massarina eburnea CBS 473.64]|uniref:Acyl-CoA N-acyltransferase n=1 Tax=Massarina eburnea CBS 473.64 TaxID=1395130 RepID=A0A6A6S0Y5_9PLEO|nr:acyl-CoA N-acyltransferase [Massarina eburnea CBS 473.64]
MTAQPAPSPSLTAISPLPSPILSTTRLIIRPMHPQDAPSLQRAASPPSIAKYMSFAFGNPYSLKHAEDWIATNLTPPLDHYVLCEKEVPEVVIGGIGSRSSGDVHSHTAEIGYWIGEPWQGLGLMREALSAYTEWCFTAREHAAPAIEGEGKMLTRLFACVVSGNTGSMKCLEACGYRAEGVMKDHVEKHGVVSDLHWYGLVKSDWEERKGGKEKGDI